MPVWLITLWLKRLLGIALRGQNRRGLDRRGLDSFSKSALYGPSRSYQWRISMWPFLFIIALVPLAFFWSDSVRELLPALAPYLPEKTQAMEQDPGLAAVLNGTKIQPTEWVIPESKSGFVAWLMSSNGQYRLAVGCRTGEPASLQVTMVNQPGKPLPIATLISGETWMNLREGRYVGETALIGAVAQFAELSLVEPGQSSPQLLGQFATPAWHSGVIARGLQQHCV